MRPSDAIAANPTPAPRRHRGEEHEMLRILQRKYDAALPAWLDDGHPKPPSGGGGGGLFATKAL